MWRVLARDAAGEAVAHFDLDETTGSISVGRSAECHLPLEHPGVSRTHAYLYVSEDQMVLEDAGSSVGTVVDGFRIEEPVFVSPGQVIQIGPFTLEVGSPEDLPEASPPGPVDDAPTGEVAAEEPSVVLAAPEAKASAAAAEAEARSAAKIKGLKLVGLSGLMAGTEIPLHWSDEIDVGRDAELEIPVLDPTVSRRHARLTRKGATLQIIDLRSSNGTFVNGERIKRRESHLGDRIRFGEVAFELQAITAAELAAGAAAARGFSRKQLILAGGGAMLVIGFVALGLFSGSPPKPKATGPGSGDQRTTSTDSKLQLQFRQKLAEARTHLEKREWAKAKEILQSTTDIFATHEARDQMLAQVNEETHHEQILTKANQLYAQGGTIDNYESALHQYELIKPSSDYFGEAQLKSDQVRVYLAEQALRDGLGYAEGRRTENKIKGAQALCRYFNLLPEFRTVGTNETKYREILQGLEKKLGKEKEYTACQAKRYLAPTPVAPGSDSVSQADVLAELKKVHQLDALVQVIELYYRGKLDESIEQMRKLKDQPSLQSQRIMLGGIFNKLSLIKGKFSEGNSLIQSGNADGAGAAFAAALAKDRELVPATLESHVKKEAARLLAEEYLRVGDTEYGRSRYEDAYALWHKGKLANPSHTGILNALLKLDRIASNWVKEAETLAAAKKTEEARQKFEAVRKITEPGTTYYTKATRALAEGAGGQ